MKTVREISELTGVSIRTLHYYDSIGLLPPTQVTKSGYRLYDGTALERLQQILLFRELQFPLKEIKAILDSPIFDRSKALEQQIALLQLRKEHIENLIDLARGIQIIGVRPSLDFSAFNTAKLDNYAAQAKATWGTTKAYQEFEEKNKYQTDSDRIAVNQAFMEIFKKIGALRCCSPQSQELQSAIGQLQQFITAHFYTCTPEILRSLGAMYAGGGSLAQAIDQAGGEGTAQLTAKAIEVYCANTGEEK